MAAYTYPGYETGQGQTLEPGNLEGGFWGEQGRSPQYPLISPPEPPPQDSQSAPKAPMAGGCGGGAEPPSPSKSYYGHPKGP